MWWLLFLKTFIALIQNVCFSRKGGTLGLTVSVIWCLHFFSHYYYLHYSREDLKISGLLDYSLQHTAWQKKSSFLFRYGKRNMIGLCSNRHGDSCNKAHEWTDLITWAHPGPISPFQTWLSLHCIRDDRNVRLCCPLPHLRNSYLWPNVYCKV